MNKKTIANTTIIIGTIIFFGIAIYFVANRKPSIPYPTDTQFSETSNMSTFEGTVIEVITAEGTKSENRYFKIKNVIGEEEYLFNDAGRNVGFEKYLNKKVKVTGYIEIGRIGWQGEEVMGIYVDKIE